MRWTYGAFGLVIAASLSVFACGRREKTEAIAMAGSTEDQLARRGEYLVTLAGCDDCHTPGGLYGAQDHSRRLSGSELGWKGPWGTSYPRNLTPDVKTGIGEWSEEDIMRSIRTGRRPDGSALLPPMPWPNYAKMNDDDARAIARYLKSITPIAHAMPAVRPPEAPADGAYLALPAPPDWDVPKGIGGGPKP